ncbi:MAG: NTP transferase domain-containing protein [Salinisphaera sp.]|nr:NTP transferase domain-containing protein [Salinisphaera sp.]
MNGIGYTALVLAGDRGPADAVARHVGAPCKALSPVNGVMLIERVLDTLSRCPDITSIQVVGPQQRLLDTQPRLAQLLQRYGASWTPPQASPSRSAAAALAHLPATQPILLTTADHALLTPSMVAQMCRAPANTDLGVGMVRHTDVMSAYPQTRRTAIRLGRDGGYCGCNLFALYRASARELVTHWQQVETRRKHPARVIAGLLGWGGIFRYGLGRLSLTAAFDRLSRRTGIRVRPIMLIEPEAAIDVDSVDDLIEVERILASRT